MSKSEYTLVLPAFTIGIHAYDAIGKITKHFGKKVVIIGGKTALSKAKQPLLDAIAKTDLEVLDVLWYGDDATFEHADRLLKEKAVQEADLVFGVGGGRAIDTGKVVADKADKAFFAFPTLASNCAPSTAISVMYKEDKSFAGYYYLDQPPVHTFINMAVIADSPFKFFWAGIGDAMSKECESELASRAAEHFHTVLLGRAIGKTCTEPLLQYGEKALADFNTAVHWMLSTGVLTRSACGRSMKYFTSRIREVLSARSSIMPMRAKFQASPWLMVESSSPVKRWLRIWIILKNLCGSWKAMG